MTAFAEAGMQVIELTVQHRMNPAISRFLHKWWYPRLTNHPSTIDRPAFRLCREWIVDQLRVIGPARDRVEQAIVNSILENKKTTIPKYI